MPVTAYDIASCAIPARSVVDLLTLEKIGGSQRARQSLSDMRLAFGHCVLDKNSRELIRDGSVVQAGPKLLRLLELLIDVRPRALTKDEIHQSIWAGTFVSDSTLSSLIAELRTAIGDDARAPRLVRTIHGYGYAFCGKITLPAGSHLASRRTSIPVFRIVVGERELALSAGAHVLGRSRDAAIFLDDLGASRRHARITIEGRGAILEDLGSKNGTSVNGAIVDGPVPLRDRARIVIGSTSLVFRMVSDGSTETQVDSRSQGPIGNRRWIVRQQEGKSKK